MSAALEDLRQRYLAAQLRGDRREAIRIVVEDGLGKGVAVATLTEEVVRAAQREIGRLWQENVIGIADEHMATAISHLALAQLYQHAEHAPPNGRRILIACVEGELHDLPARLVADALDSAGFDVWFLGADVPTDHLVRMVRNGPPDLIALSATMSFHGPALRAAIRALRSIPGRRIPIAVGGNACVWSPGLAAEIAADFTASSAYDFVEGAKKLLGVTGQAA